MHYICVDQVQWRLKALRRSFRRLICSVFLVMCSRPVGHFTKSTISIVKSIPYGTSFHISCTNSRTFWGRLKRNHKKESTFLVRWFDHWFGFKQSRGKPSRLATEGELHLKFKQAFRTLESPKPFYNQDCQTNLHLLSRSKELRFLTHAIVTKSGWTVTVFSVVFLIPPNWSGSLSFLELKLDI